MHSICQAVQASSLLNELNGNEPCFSPVSEKFQPMLTMYALYVFPYLCIYLLDYSMFERAFGRKRGGPQQRFNIVKNDGLHFGSRWRAVRRHHLGLHEQGLRLLP